MALVVVMGIPGSGKTYLSKRLCERIGNGCRVFSFDDIYNDDGLMDHIWGHNDRHSSFLGVYGLNNDRTARNERKRCESRVSDFLRVTFCGTEKSDSNHRRNIVVIVDDVFYLSSMRRPFERMARLHRLAYIIIHVDVSIDKALLQNQSRAMHQRIPEYMIRNMWQRIEVPNNTYRGVTVLRYSGDGCVDKLVAKINDAALTHATVKTGKVDTCCSDNSNEILEHDLCWEKLEVELRKIVGELMKEYRDGQLARALTVAKRELANELRTHDIREWDRQRLKEILMEKVKGQLERFVLLHLLE